MNDRTKGITPRGAAVAGRQGNAQDFVRGVIAELRRVTWPTREEWMSATILTIVLVVSIGLYTFVVDWLVGVVIAWVHPG